VKGQGGGYVCSSHEFTHHDEENMPARSLVLYWIRCSDTLRVGSQL